jgi:hypothetical protein
MTFVYLTTIFSKWGSPFPPVPPGMVANILAKPLMGLRFVDPAPGVRALWYVNWQRIGTCLAIALPAIVYSLNQTKLCLRESFFVAARN